MINDISYRDVSVKPISGLYYDNGNRGDFFWSGGAGPDVTLGLRMLSFMPDEDACRKTGMHRGLYARGPAHGTRLRLFVPRVDTDGMETSVRTQIRRFLGFRTGSHSFETDSARCFRHFSGGSGIQRRWQL